MKNKTNTMLDIFNHLPRPTPMDYVDFLSHRHKFITINNNPYVYVSNSGTYSGLFKETATSLIISTLIDTEHPITDIGICTKIYNILRTDPRFTKDLNEIPSIVDYINFKNGVLDLTTGELMGHTPEKIFFSCIDSIYDPSQKSGPIFDHYIDICSNNDSSVKSLLLEIMGYIISNYMEKKIFFLIGVHDAGKTTFGNFLRSLIGPRNTSTVPLHMLSDKHMLAELQGKKLNMCMEIESTPIKDVTLLKYLSGRDPIKANPKWLGIIEFINEAKLLFGGNALPPVTQKKDLEAFFNRLCILPFVNTVDKEDQINDLVDKLIGESSYIINCILAALIRLRSNNFIFTSSIMAERIRYEYISQNDSVIGFIHYECSQGFSFYEPCVDLYNNYLQFCDERSIEITYRRKFNEFLTSIRMGFNIHDRTKIIDGNEIKCFDGIKLKKHTT